MKNLLTRSLTGALFVGVIIGAVFFGVSVFIGLFSVFTVVGVWEFYRIAGFKDSHNGSVKTGIYLSAFVFLLTSLVAAKLLPAKILLSIPAFMFPAVFSELYRKKDSPVHNVALILFPSFYIALPFALLNYLFLTATASESPVLIISFFVFIWTNDSFAYLTGVSIGKHRLFERISPKKSWEGLFGGILFTALAAFLISTKYDILNPWQWIVMGVIVSLAGTFGDLLESMFKRSAGIKDSGKILPGHGGVLDRFDGVLAASPFVVFYLFVLGIIG